MQRVLWGQEGWRELTARAEAQCVRRVFLVCGDTTYHRTGIAERLQNAFGSRRIVRFSAFSPNPTLEMVRQAAALFNGADADWIVAAGGGSAIDIAKCVKALAQAPEYLNPDHSGWRPPPAPLRLAPTPLVAVPTTAGSGSECTHFAVVYIGERKHSLEDAGLVPDIALLDSELTASLPPLQTAVTGLDALGQSIEALWSVRSTPESDAYAMEAFDLAHRALPHAVANLPVARVQMLRGAHLAGKAINIAQTTAAHAFSYALTKRLGLAHGHAVWMTLPALVGYNGGVSDSDCLHPRGAEHVHACIGGLARRLGLASADALAVHAAQFAQRLGIDLRWSSAGVGSRTEALDLLRLVNADRLANNPRRMDLEALFDHFIQPMQACLTEVLP
jgi:alcohol dehydrogenase class IV